MPHWLVIGLFVGIVAALTVILLWEFKRAREAPAILVVQRYINSAGSSPPARLPKETKRGFDGWN